MATPAPPCLPASPIPGLRTVELDASWEAPLQRFFDSNPLYFETATGKPAQPTDARDEIRDTPPKGWSYGRLWLIGLADAQGELAAMASIVSDLLAAGVWHMGLYIVATDRHGSGDAQRWYQTLESWCEATGASWMRLGVIRGNARAERFWQRQGFVQTRLREGVVMGERTHTVRVMVKPLGAATVAQYLERVERDRPAVRIETTDAPDAASLAVVDAGLEAHNSAVEALADVRPLAAFATDEAGTVIGGAVGRTWGECCELLQLWVAPERRGTGNGAGLLHAFEARARQRGCSRLYLTTFSFQAPDFYLRRGYEVQSCIAGYTGGVVKYLMVKNGG